MSELDQIKERLRSFAKERDWEKFHTPKNLAMALSGEAGELVSEFQWLTVEESQNLSPEQLSAVRMEIADVAIYLVRLADVLNVDIYGATLEKIEINEGRFRANS
jgi:NTP pyrophosphatase (non-canonical NTP hydrolase)